MRERVGTPPDVLPGVQPEVDGKLICLECGLGFVGLGQHVVRAHLPVAEYRRIHELPPTLGLHASALKQWRSRSMREKFKDPEVRAAFKPRRGVEELIPMAIQAKREAKERAGVQAARKAAIAKGVAVRRAKAEEKYRLMAKTFGYADMPALLAANRALSNSRLATVLGLDHRSVEYLRNLHGAQFRSVRTPSGSRDARLVCLECGRTFRSLYAHISQHALSPQQYRHRHGLAEDARLRA